MRLYALIRNARRSKRSVGEVIEISAVRPVELAAVQPIENQL
jgi:hypothetical protein